MYYFAHTVWYYLSLYCCSVLSCCSICDTIACMEYTSIPKKNPSICIHGEIKLRWMDGWMDGCMGGGMEGWMNRWMDGGIDGEIQSDLGPLSCVFCVAAP